MKLLYVSCLIFLMGCGKISTNITDIVPEEPVAVVFSIPVVGECTQLNDGVWIENEGNKADIYNNSDCNHNPLPKTAYCDNIYPLDMCQVGNFLFWIEGTNNTMIAVKYRR